MTKIVRTAFDISRYHGPTDGLVALDSARKLHPSLDLAAIQRSLKGFRGFHGLSKFRELVKLSRNDVDSPLESMSRYVLLTAKIPNLRSVEVQVEISAATSMYRVDMLLNGTIIVELDGDVKYDGTTYGKTDEVIRQERQREKLLQNEGFYVIRATYQDCIADGSGEIPLVNMVARALQVSRTSRSPEAA